MTVVGALMCQLFANGWRGFRREAPPKGWGCKSKGVSYFAVAVR